MWRGPFKAFLDEVVTEARQRAYLESSGFFKGFGEGNEVREEDFDNRKIGVGERIAWVMHLFWRPISKFESVAELHRFLSAAAKATRVTITLKRVEKLCSRIGLRFKGRGRPRKRIIQTKLLPST